MSNENRLNDFSEDFDSEELENADSIDELPHNRKDEKELDERNKVYTKILNNYYNSIKNFIIVRIGNKKFDEIVISRLFRTNLLTIILGYIVPIFLYFNKFYSYYRYITFIIIQYFLFTLYMAITFLYVKITNKYLKTLLFLLPFVINIAIQIFFFQFYY